MIPSAAPFSSLPHSSSAPPLRPTPPPHLARQLSWLQTVKQYLLDSRHASELPSQLFFKLPVSLRLTGNDAQPYKPILFKFGLWHGAACFDSLDDDPGSSPALLFKLQAAKLFCEMAKSPASAHIPTTAFEHLAEELMKWEGKIRKCYGHFALTGLKDVDAEAAAYVMALDVVTVFVAFKTEKMSASMGFHPPCIRSIVRSDAMLLDNQLPVFAFLCLLKVLQQRTGKHPDIRQIIELFAHRHSPFDSLNFSYSHEYLNRNGSESLLGCIYSGWVGDDDDTELMHASLAVNVTDDDIGGTSEKHGYVQLDPSSRMRRRIYSRSGCVLSAARLYRHGIRFKAASNRPSNLATSISFDRNSGTVTLPKITVAEGTERFLLNLLAYEHTSRFWKPCTLLSFVSFMDMLINDAEDVEVLVECGVVENALGSHKQLAVMWNGLTGGHGYPFRLSSAQEAIFDSISSESRRRWPRWRYMFLDTYVEKQPWLLISVMAATVLLVLSVLQTIYTMKGGGGN